ncbi:MAG: VOC family protein [Bacteroidetes bacterium]|nr:VOC family protein [Bacteroidota bacterium]
MCATITSRIKAMSQLLIVSNLERSIAYYREKLGFGLDFRYEDFYAGISRDGYSVHLKSSDRLVESQTGNEDPEIIFRVEGIDDLYRECLNRSANVIQPLRDMPYGKEFYVTDPDGNLIAFVE